ncbi:probable JmjC domain-containing histone demethylation protein 2C isoform X4 [Manacus candei]|uniref:probable JmjC domain-containing histone demethylation protein 2C isoform X4 n=1 Tax=Manacus candei TaxID=415023 RepID=UPI0022261F04|nr:probable JmjC domain-containing histone demethylation protein 2C isoform X4 [Manacus candei]
MAVETRPELVGKRFLCLGGEEPPESGRWRAGVIRAVSQRDSHSPELAVYVEFDDLEWEKREWVKVYEDFATFLVEYQLVWAKRKDPSQTQGSKIKQIQWPALTFKPLVGKSVYDSITAVEFLVDKQLDFITEDSAFQPYQDDVDSLNPVLRDNPQLHEEVKAWVKEQKVQEIFMQGPYSLNGYRVRVYRQDSATQWFTGIITHHDLFTRTMVVMNDQVLEPQNVDPSMVQMTFLDDVVHSLLKGENIGITSRRRSRSNQNSNTVHGHYTRAQANSPRPAMNSQTAAPKQNSHQHQQQRNTRPNKRKGSDSSIPDEEKMKDERYDYIGRGENPKTKNKHFLSKRRKPEEDEKKLNMKRLRTDNISDYSESSDSEISNKRLTDSSSEQNSENELKSKNTSKINGEEGKSQPTEGVEQTLTDRRSPWDEVQEDKNHEETERLKSSVLDQQEKSSLHAGEQPTPYEQNAKDVHALECNAEKHHTAELKNEQFLPRPPTPKCVVDVTNKNNSEKENQDNAASTFGLQTVQKIESHSSDLKQQFANANFLEARKQEADQSWVNSVVKTDLIQPGVVKALPVNEHLNSEKEKVQYGSFMSSLNVASLAEESKLRKQSPAPDSVKSKSSASVDHPKTKSPDVKPKFTQSSDTVKSKYPNGTHAYSGLGLPSSKWVHPETPVNAEASLRRNTPSPWLHQPTPVTSADSLGLLSHIPVRPSSADPLRPLKLTTHSSPPLSKSIVEHRKEELERKAFVEPLRSVTTAPVKTELEQSRTQAAKESHMHRHFADPMLNQLPRPPQETGERLSKYKEEHRRILQESIEVAPFTAKIKALEGERENYSRVTSLSSSPKSHSVKYDKDAERSVSELYKMKHSVPQSLPQSNYFTTLSNSVVNEPPRSYLSKEASGAYVDKQTNCPSTAASPQALPSYISSLSKPPPLIKHQPESEGSTSKVPEQLSQSVQSHSVNSFRSDSRSPTQLSVSSSNTLRSMPALHRAPVFHPPVHQNLEKKESSYSSLSPPTLTPVQPVNAGGGGKIQELQKPPTLVPEPKEAQTVYKGTSEQNVSEMWKSNNAPNNEKADWHVERMSGKSQSAMASVIVRPSSSTKYDSVAVVQPASKDRASERSSAVTNQADCLKTAEARETGRVILPNMNSDSARTQYEKKFPAVSQGSIPRAATPTTTIICSTKTDVTTSAATTTSVSSWSSSEVTYSLSSTVLACTALECPASRAGSQAVAQAQECKVSTPAPVTPAAGSAAQPSSGFSTSTDFVHLKKHKAALAAAQFKSSNTSEAESNSVKNQTFSTSLSLDSGVVCNTINKANSVGSGQTSQTSQPNYHTKLKKAWLTRHSEEDKNTNKKENSGNSVSEIIKPCTVNLIASTSNDLQNNIDSKILADKFVKEEKHPRRKGKRTYESGSESGDSDESESKSEQRTKRQPKPTYKKKQNDLQKKKGDTEEEVKPNGVLSRSAKEKSKLKLQSSNNSTGIPRSVLKDWRKVKKLKQTGESFLQDDSCSEIGPNLQKCRECRLIRSKKGEEPTHSPVFCRFYYFRRLSFSKNGVVRIDGFSSPDQYDDEALSLWTHENYDDDELDLETSKYILDIIGDKFCQLVTSEKTAMSWVKKDAKIAWKRAVRGVREMCDACEATLFNIHWVCQKCGFVVCLDCYKAKERKSSRDKELYAWMKCVKGQPHDHKHLMPTQIIPGSVLTDLLDAMHNIREKFEIKSHCQCTSKQSTQAGKLPAMNGVSQVLQNVLNHSNKISLCMPESQQQNTPQKSETNGNTSPRSDVSTDSKLTPPESQSPLHWLADLAEQKAREEKKENKECPSGKHSKEEKDQDNLESQNCKNSPPASQNNEQGSTLRDLLTTTAGKLRLGSTDAGIAFAPVYSTGTASGKSGRTMPNILDDIIASVVENKIPPNRAPKINVKSEIKDEPKDDDKCIQDDCSKRYSDIQYSWICDKHVLWLRDHKNSNNWKLFKECWKQGRPVLVSGMHKKMNFSLWKAESISLDFGNQQADILNCKDSIISNTNVKEFWDGFEDVSKRQKVKNGETALLKLKDWPSGEDFKAMMPARYEDLLKSLPLPEYCSPEGKLNLASHLPGFFVRPDLGPRLCSAYGVAATKDHDIGTTNLHIEVSDVVNILVYVGIAKGNGVLSKSGVLKKLEEEDLDDLLRKRLKDSSELPGALWHIYAGKDADKIREFLQKIAKEQGLEVLPEHDPIRDQSWYVNRKLRQRLFEEYGVKTCTVIQFLGDAIILPAGALHQVQNFHSCVQVTEDFVSPEHLVQSFHLTQELRLSKEEINYDDKLQVKNILYHAVKEMVRALKIHEGEMEDMDEN